VSRAIPYLVQPEGVVAGKALWYASTCGGCPAACGCLVKVRDGRPVKLEGHGENPWSLGGLCAAGQAHLVELYDQLRLREVTLSGKSASWEEALSWMRQGLHQGMPLYVVTRGASSPTLQRVLAEVAARYPVRLFTHLPPTLQALRQAHLLAFGIAAVPGLALERAKVVVSFGADFLGSFLASPPLAGRFRQARDLARGENRCFTVQLESYLSITGAKADRRVSVAPGMLGAALQALVAKLQRLAGRETLPEPPLEGGLGSLLEELARRLWAARPHALVLCGADDAAWQLLACAANELLGAYGEILDLQFPLGWGAGSGEPMAALRAALAADPKACVLFADVNPVLELPDGETWPEVLAQVPFTAALVSLPHETARQCKALLPLAHPLECWGDWEPVRGLVSWQQPTVAGLSQGKTLPEVLAALAGVQRGGRELVEETYRTLPHQGEVAPFEVALERGFARLARQPLRRESFRWDQVRPLPPRGEQGLSLVLYPSVALGWGEHAHNPFLQELPDPITKLTWGNAAWISPETAKALGVSTGQLVRLSTASGRVELPALVQQGVHPGVVAVAVGYGGLVTARFHDFGPRWLGALPRTARVGVRVEGLGGAFGAVLVGVPVKLEALPVFRKLATTQEHHRLEVPERLRPEAYPHREIALGIEAGKLSEAEPRPAPADLWPDDFPPKGERWAMAVDLDACIGCGACVVACQLENNVPVVGEDEVRRHREMHWLRVDRYFLGEGEQVQAVFQPVMCQQCGHAPCETVCPVLATVHSEDGLNQQVYNRCVGTRYCANNCPYKVRRFNWFSYAAFQEAVAPALNPDVTVRSRGVMEKCTFCVQRIVAARQEARERGEAFHGALVRTACQESCPTQAITFGNLLDPASAVATAWQDPRAYRLLEELGVRPQVAYLKFVRPEGSHA